MNYDEFCRTIMEKGIKKLYIYPFGNRGKEFKDYLLERYGYSGEWCIIDNALSKWNKTIHNMDCLREESWNEETLLIIASDNPEIYRDLRVSINKTVPEKNVLDLFPINPLCFHSDPRVAALAISAEEIHRNEVNGAVAEAGVYRGEFARFINMLFPERKIYLFDSFEGISERSFDLENDTYEQVKNWGGYKADTSVETVLKRLPFSKNAIVKRGYVPDTLTGIEECFAFVNLDMDLYMPTYEALKYFWNRMSPGGYIFVHDVNNYEGCGKAVRVFCKEYKTGYICLNDRITAAILKP